MISQRDLEKEMDLLRDAVRHEARITTRAFMTGWAIGLLLGLAIMWSAYPIMWGVCK